MGVHGVFDRTGVPHGKNLIIPISPIRPMERFLARVEMAARTTIGTVIVDHGERKNGDQGRGTIWFGVATIRMVVGEEGIAYCWPMAIIIRVGVV